MIGGIHQAFRRFKMRAYPYFQKERRSGEERRTSRVRVCIIFQNIDRRKINDSYYNGPERRSGRIRRGLIWDRRKPKLPCYGNSVPFSEILHDKYRLSVYSMLEDLEIAKITKLREKLLRTPKFILDADLGRLAKYLRMLGFDTLYRSNYKVREIVDLAISENRKILTRNRELLFKKAIVRCYLLKNTDPKKQLKEILKLYDLTTLINPFSRCTACNKEVVFQPGQAEAKLRMKS
jgi:uncharacterized protein with PIN domain